MNFPMAPQKTQLRERNSEINLYFTRVISAKNEVDIGGYGPTQDRASIWMPMWKRVVLLFNSPADRCPPDRYRQTFKRSCAAYPKKLSCESVWMESTSIVEIPNGESGRDRPSNCVWF